MCPKCQHRWSTIEMAGDLAVAALKRRRVLVCVREIQTQLSAMAELLGDHSILQPRKKNARRPKPAGTKAATKKAGG